MTPVSTRRYKIRRAIERGDPRLGLVVGVILAALSATAFARRDWVGIAETLELKALDFVFKQRSPIKESDQIVLVSMDDSTMRKLQWPIPRENYAQATLALDRLGASQIIYDVEFKTFIPRKGDYDEETGEYRLNAGERLLRQAIAKSGKVTLAYHFDLEDPFPAALRPRLDGLKKAFSANVRAEADEVARVSGAPREWIQRDLESLREIVLVHLVAEDLAARPTMKFADLRAKYLPGYDPNLHSYFLNLLQYAWQMGRAVPVAASKASVGVPLFSRDTVKKAYGIVPPLFPFLEVARAVGAANAEADAQDGVIRRPWSHLSFQGKSFAYLGLQAGMEALSGPGVAVDNEVFDDRVDIVVRNNSCEQARIGLPRDWEGRILVNWAGNRHRKRGETSTYFSNVPFIQLVEAYLARYVELDGTVRRTLINQLTGEEREMVKGDEYLKLSDRLAEVLGESSNSLPSGCGRWKLGWTSCGWEWWRSSANTSTPMKRPWRRCVTLRSESRTARKRNWGNGARRWRASWRPTRRRIACVRGSRGSCA